jgi:hypothetical protein
MRSVNEAGRQINNRKLQVIEKPKQVSCTLLTQTQDDIYYRWRYRGVSMRNISTMFRIPRDVVEAVCQKKSAESDHGPNRPGGAAVIPMRRAA